MKGTEGITVVALASVLTLVACIWVVVFCVRQKQSTEQVQVIVPEMQRQIGFSIGHHGLKKRV
jgi:hypothetical protein